MYAGDNVRSHTKLQSNGSTDFFLSPIPTELLSLAVSTPHTLGVHIKSIPTACTSPDGHGNCTFRYDAASTPNISDYTPKTLMFEGDSTAELTITGSGFNADPALNRVLLDATPCNITAASDTRITCYVTDDTPGGTRKLGVYVDNLGFAAPHNQEVQVRTAFVQDAEPKVLHANGNAQETTLTMVNIHGKVG